MTQARSVWRPSINIGCGALRAFAAAVALTIVASALTGCSSDQSADFASVQPVPPVTAAQRALFPDVSNIADYMPNGSVPPGIVGTPETSGGLLIGAPTASGATNKAEDFACSCSDYLQIVAASQPGLGASPSVTSIVRAEAELGIRDMRLKASDVPGVARALGVTDVALATFSAAGSGYDLSYLIVDAKSGAPVGAPITLSGSEASILSQLPAAARQIGVQLGVPNAESGPPAGCSPAEFAYVGHQFKSFDITPAAEAQLSRLGARCASAAYLALWASTDDTGAQVQKTALATMARLPQNPLVYSVIEYRYPKALKFFERPLLQDVVAYPYNSMYWSALATIYDKQGGAWFAAQNAGIAAVNAAPQNPDEWSDLGGIYSDQADAVRQGRPIGVLTQSLLSSLDTPYAYWLGCSETAVKLDSSDARALGAVSSAAAFTGHGSEAQAALRHEMHVAKDPYSADWWALELYLNRWYGDEAKLAAAAAIAANDPRLSADEESRLSEHVDKTKHFFLWRMLAYSSLAKAKAQEARYPKDPAAIAEVGTVLTNMGRAGDALSSYEKAAKTAPSDPAAEFDAGECLYDLGKYPQAMSYLRTAAALDPTYPKVHYLTGLADKRERKFPQALAELNKELALYPGSTVAYDGLGDVYYETHRYAKAAQCFLAFCRAYPWNSRDWDIAADSFDRAGNCPAALAAIADAQTFFPNDTNLPVTQEDCYLKMHQPDRTLDLCNSIIGSSTDPAALGYAYENKAEAYLQEDKLAKARKYWKLTIANGEPYSTADAKAFLRKYGT